MHYIFISILVVSDNEKVDYILKNNTRTGELAETYGIFNTSILSEQQSEITKVFDAGKTPEEIDLLLKTPQR